MGLNRTCNFRRISAVIHPGGNNALNPEGDLTAEAAKSVDEGSPHFITYFFYLFQCNYSILFSHS